MVAETLSETTSGLNVPYPCFQKGQASSTALASGNTQNDKSCGGQALEQG